MTSNDGSARELGPGPRIRWTRAEPVRSAGLSQGGWAEDAGASALLEAARTLAQRPARENRWLVRGGPGTGKSTLLAAAVSEAIASGIWGGRIAVLGSSARSVDQLRRFIASAVAANVAEGTAAASVEPQVRTVHSLAFAIVAMAASRAGEPAPRLLTGAEHDAIFRQALLGYSEDGGGQWPEHVRPALATRGFARELRDVVLRLTERNVAPEKLSELGAGHGRPLWESAAHFAARHEQEMELRTAASASEDAFPTSLNAAQLVGRAIDELGADPDLLSGANAIDLVVVDDAQLIDPMAGELIATIARSGASVIAAHSGDEAVFRFRGASDEFAEKLSEQGAREIELARVHRGPAAAAASGILAQRLPGAARWRRNIPAIGTPAGPHEAPVVSYRTERSASEESAVVADYLLRKHHVHEVPWDRMAVVFRTVGDGAELLQRQCDSVGIPIVDAGAEVPPAEDPMVRALLDVIESVLRTPDEQDTRTLLMGPLGKADPADFRDLRRTLRRLATASGTPQRSMTAVRDLLLGEDEPATILGEDAYGRLSTPVERIRALRAVVAASIAAGDSVEMVLWNLWHSSNKAYSLRAVTGGGGVAARAADRSADAVMGLFDHAADFVEQMPRGSLRQFVEMMREQELPAPRRAGRRPNRKAVSLLSAHNAVAAEYDVVVVAGVQEGVWPSPRRRFGLFELELLVDLLDRPHMKDLSDAQREAAGMAASAADERKLAVLAASRARENILFTAVDNGEDLAASQFIDELARAGVPRWAAGDAAGETLTEGHRMFTPGALVADLRAQLQTAPGAAESDAAARVLATLRTSGFGAASARRWYRSTPVSSNSSPVPEKDKGPRARISPSAFEELETCPLRWFIGRQMSSGTEMPLLKGNVVHAIAQAVQSGVGEGQIESAVREFWPAMSPAAGWVLDTEIEDILASEKLIRGWVANQVGYTKVGVEVPFRMELYPGGPSVEVDEEAVPAVSVSVSGRIDRLDRDESGHLRAVDFKSGGKAVTGAEAEANPQLAFYQLASRLGAIGGELAPRATATDEAAADDPVNKVAGGVLVYVNQKAAVKKGANERVQPAMRTQTHLELIRRATVAGALSIGPDYPAITSKACESCSAASMCPTQNTGRQVGR